MSFPQIIEYNDAVQNPRSFSDAELQKGSVAETPLGLPLALSGGFALTYIVETGNRKYAVRCFHREVPEAQQRYAQISQVLQSLNSPYFVYFDFQATGIAISGKRYPVVKMDWVEGDTLGMYLDRWASKAPAIASLQQGFSNLADYLERNGVAHGDIQNENVIVAGTTIRLIDYDGMFVPGMKEGLGTEVGHKHFQHPAREKMHFGPKMDRFSFIVLDTSLQAIQSDPNLHKRFREGGQAIIFKANDYASPDSSELFRLLDGIPAVREKAKALAAICKSSINVIPTLADFRSGLNIPTPTASPVTSTKARAAPKYIGAFSVLDASEFGDVLNSVGDKVELVGKIVSVKQGVGKRGRGRGRPYVFINFGQWNKESVKITIWSEGLNNISVRPDETWVGKWISVTGLLEPPYEGRHYGKAYRSVGITVDSDNQIIHLSERDARFRLNQGGSPTRGGTESSTPSGRNNDILTDIKGGRPSKTPPQQTPAPTRHTPAATPVGTKARNDQILKGITTPTRSQPGTSQWPNQQRGSPAPARVSHSAGIFSKVPVWVWIVGVIALMYFLTRK